MKSHDVSRKDREEALCEAFASLKNAAEVRAFLNDLCTPAEREAMADRLLVARILTGDVPYRTIAGDTGVSVTTVTRVARCLRGEDGGYQTVLGRMGDL